MFLADHDRIHGVGSFVSSLTSNTNKGGGEFRAISEIARAKKPPLLKQETDIHLVRILDWLIEQTMTERLIASVNIKGVNKVKPREEQKPLLPNHYSIRVRKIASKTRHSVHSPEEVSCKFNIGI